MPAYAWTTVIISALIIGVTGVALLRVIIHLLVVRRTLGTITVGAQVIAYQTRTVPQELTSVNADLKPVRDFCEQV